MSKRARSGGNEPPSKRHCSIDVQDKSSLAVPPALYDNGAWEILAKFLTTSMSLSEVDGTHIAYLGDRYLADEWAEPRRLLFSGDEDNTKFLENFTKLWKTHIPNPQEKSSISIPASRRNGYSSSSCAQKSRKLSKAASKFIADKANVGDDEEEEEEYDGDDWDGPSTQSPVVTSLPGTLAKRRLAATFDDMATQFEQHLPSSSEDNLAYRSPESRMYLLHVQNWCPKKVQRRLKDIQKRGKPRKDFPDGCK
ncbi:hypothetical protein C8R48DRAFT_676914 [Suillus tomentosus]|nr:hypothetical protein C8R48DRAFT_676914 [Suillus tomentosus]